MRRGANSVTSAVPIGSTLPMPMPAEIPKMIRSRPKNRKQRTPPVSKEFTSLFSLCYLLLEKLSKFLIPLSDCPFVLNRLPVFLGKSPCFREKQQVIPVSSWKPSMAIRSRAIGELDGSIGRPDHSTRSLRGRPAEPLRNPLKD